MKTQKLRLIGLMGGWIICLVFAMSTTVHSQDSPSPISQDAALTYTQKFCAAIGQYAKLDTKVPAFLDSSASPAIAMVPTLANISPSHILPPTYWQPCWHLTLQNNVRVAVVASTGIISKYQNIGLMNTLSSDKIPTGQALSEQQAIGLATSAIKATGQHDNLVFLRADLWGASASSSSGQEWIVRWGRTLHGIPYHSQHASVLLQAATGDVEEIVLMYSMPPYTGDTTKLAVSQSVAVKAATDYCTAASISLPFESTHLEIVQPNNLLTSRDDAEVGDQASHIAWVCRYTENGKTFDIWVDAQTGVLLGGEASQITLLQLPRKLQKKPLPH